MILEEERTRAEHPLADVRILRRILAALGDSHLFVELTVPAEDSTGFIPFLLKRVENAYLIDAAVGAIPVGTELVSVNGITANALIARLAGLANVDGNRPAVREAEAERRLIEYAWVELGPQESWEVLVRSPVDGSEAVYAVDGVTLEAARRLETQRRSIAVWGDRDGSAPLLRKEGAYTVLRLAAFSGVDRESYLETIEALAPEFSTAPRLIIDLRGNEGGDRSLGVAIARHLLGRPFAQWSRVRTRVRAIDEAFEDSITFMAGSLASLTDFPGERTESGWVFQGDPLAGTMTPHGEEYPGTLTLFIDDATNSAAVEFAIGLLAHHPRVQVVGTESQGECAWHVGQLPVIFADGQGPSMLSSLFEIEHVNYPGCRRGRGIEPDLRIDYTRADFEAGRDPFLNALD